MCRKSIKGSPFSSPKDTDSGNEEQQELDSNNQAVKQLKDEIVHKKLYSLLLKDYIEPFLQGIYIFVPKDELIGISPHVLRKQLESGVIDDEAVARWKTITTWYSCPIKGQRKRTNIVLSRDMVLGHNLVIHTNSKEEIASLRYWLESHSNEI